ncbi:hypothetical protein [Emticicia soli]|uniref:hypothetical protein n=1 Tax=Emticicia soli TaxID=2027878 RepID=UPI0036D385BD
MKSTELKNKAGTISLIILLVLIFFSNIYAQRTDFLISTVVPAARGYVDINLNHEKNYVIKVYVSDLTEVKRLVPSKHSYVVWMITEQTILKNIGQINSLTGFFVKKIKESLEIISPFKPIKVFITTEYDSRVRYPSADIVLSTQNI